MASDRNGRAEGKVAIVTGAGMGLGQASAILLAQEGAKVVVSDVKADLGQATVDTIKGQGGDAIFVKADVADSAEVQELMKACVKQYDTLDVLHNSAGIWMARKDAPVAEVSEDVWHTTIAVNLTGTFLCCKYAIPIMMENKNSSIINMSSIAGITATINHCYSASKGGVLALTRSIAVSYAPYNIRANALCPGLIETPMTQPIRDDSQWGESYINKTPLGRFGKPTDIAYLILYLASDESAYVTGAAISIDGGFAAV